MVSVRGKLRRIRVDGIEVPFSCGAIFLRGGQFITVEYGGTQQQGGGRGRETLFLLSTGVP